MFKLPSQFLKRKLKSKEQEPEIQPTEPSDAIVDTPEIDTSPESLPEVNLSPDYTQTALDIYTPDGGKNYEVAEISYNHLTKEAKVTATFSISRLVALTYQNQKTSLNTLKRKLPVIKK